MKITDTHRQDSSAPTASLVPILPYSLIVGQEQLKLALELAYIAPQLGGVLISGHRGTGKSTAVRAFAQMVYGDLPVTLPINATEDRVVGGLDVDQLMQSQTKWKDGLLVEANQKLLYVDEVNLLDDHIVNIILDVTSTGKLEIQRDGQSSRKDLAFTLVGTMNPEEGGLRPQLLDRFGLMVSVTTETDPKQRLAILQNVLAFDEGWFHREQQQPSEFLDQAEAIDRQKFAQLQQARARFRSITIPPEALLQKCVDLAKEFRVEGNRGERVLAMAARAYAALQAAPKVTLEHLEGVAPLALQHRRPEMAQSNQAIWTDKDQMLLRKTLGSE